jgi:hypothetical protein
MAMVSAMLATESATTRSDLGADENSLDNFLTRGYLAIEGWLLEPAVRMTLALAG